MGRFVVDFVCVYQKLIIEVDGAQHYAEQRAYDVARDRWLRSQGFRVLRFSDTEVLTRLDSVEQAILEALQRPHPSPPPEPGEGAKVSKRPYPITPVAMSRSTSSGGMPRRSPSTS
jgi:hypothetical protein